MTTGLTLYAEGGGFDSRLFFTGLLANVVSGGGGGSGSDGNMTDANMDFTYNNIDYNIAFEGDHLKFTPDGLSGFVTSMKLVKLVDNEEIPIASIAVFLGSEAPSVGIPVDSSFYMTPNGLLNSLSKHGGGQFSFIGNTGNDKLLGSDYGDYFNGANGNDQLTGNGGADEFLFDAIGKKNADHIVDFQAGLDQILIDRLDDPQLFAGVTTKNLSKTFHDITSQAEQKDDRILYNHKTGTLSYDSDGKGGHDAIVFAYLDNHASLDWRDFAIF